MSLNLIKLYQKQSTWYKGTTTGVPVGICIHDTGCNNTTLKRYVQPNDDDANRAEMIKLIGENKYKNDWNHIKHNAGVNAWIGKLADGSIATVQAAPWNYRPWGVGSGKYGSLNGTKTANSPFWLQFEICEDDRTNSAYFDKIYAETIGLCAYWCDMFGFDPYGTVTYKGHSIPVITCHQDSYKLGFGGNHSDIYDWFPKYGVTMDMIRKDVAESMTGKTETKSETSTSYRVRVTADVLNIRSGAGTKYNIVGTIRDKGVYTIVETQGTWGKLKSGAGWISLNWTTKV